MLAGVAGGLAALAGCLGGPGASTPQRLAYTLTITRSGDSLEMRIDPAGDVADVIRINVGDTVEFTVVNEAGVPVGVHNHATDTEFVVDPGDQRGTSFEATEAMTGRQEIEGWVADDGSGGSAHGEDAITLAVIEVRPRGS